MVKQRQQEREQEKARKVLEREERMEEKALKRARHTSSVSALLEEGSIVPTTWMRI